jgi:hypothetical protein
VPECDRSSGRGRRESEDALLAARPLFLGRIRTSAGHGRPGSVARDARRSRPPLAVSALSWWAAGVAAAAEEDVVVVVGRGWRRGRQGRGEQGAGPAGEGLI